jgi:hypothetical protein
MFANQRDRSVAGVDFLTVTPDNFMNDLFFIGLTIGFFVLMLIFIWACEKV